MSNPDVLFNEEILSTGANIVKETNKEIAKLIGINPAARTTWVKPSGNASVLLKTPSGIHPEHSPMYIRNIQISKDIALKKGDYLSLESKSSKIKGIKAGLESGKLSEEFGNKLLEEAEKIPEFVRFEIIKVNKE